MPGLGPETKPKLEPELAPELAPSAGHPGEICIDGRGHKKHYWNCCGQHLNEISPSGRVTMLPGEAQATEGEWVARALDKRTAWRQLQLRAQKAKKLREPPEKVTEYDRAAAMARSTWVETEKSLRRAHCCTESDRAAWEARKKHMQHVYEVLQTEEVYVKALRFTYAVWYRPLAHGTHGAPKLSRELLDRLFSTMFCEGHVEESETEADAERSTSQRYIADALAAPSQACRPPPPPRPAGCAASCSVARQARQQQRSHQRTRAATLLMTANQRVGGNSSGPGSPMAVGNTHVSDIVQLQTDFVLRLLTEEDRKEHPNIAAVFETKIGKRRVVEHLEMYAPFAANFQSAIERLERLRRESPPFAAFEDAVLDIWRSDSAQQRLKEQGLRSLPVQLDKLLGLPVQRIPRYQLLLQEVKKSMGDKSAGYDGGPMPQAQLVNTMRSVEAVCHSLNELSMRSSEGLKKLAELSDLMGQGGARFRRKSGIDLVVPGREWIKGDGDDAMFYCVDPLTLQPNLRRPVQLLLFNDLLVVVEASRIDRDYALEYLCHFDLQEPITVCGSDGSRHKECVDYLMFAAPRRGTQWQQAQHANAANAEGEEHRDEEAKTAAEMQVQIFASEWRRGSKRARQHVQAWARELADVAEICAAITRQQTRMETQREAELLRTAAAGTTLQSPTLSIAPDATGGRISSGRRLHEMQLAAFSHSIDEHVKETHALFRQAGWLPPGGESVGETTGHALGSCFQRWHA